MNILYISHLHPPAGAPLKNIGGMQRVSMQLVETLSNNQDISINTIKLEASWGNIGIKTTLFLVDNVVKLPDLAEKYKAEVILFSSMVTASLAPFLRKRLRIPMVTINHGHDVTLSVGIYQMFLRKVFQSLDGVISVSQATREASIKRGMDPDKGIALPNGFNPEEFGSMECDKNIAREALKEQLGLQLNGEKILLTTGRLVRRKGHAWFINQVMPRIKSDVCYIVLGDGPEMKAIIEAVQSSEVRHRIKLLGRQSDQLLKMAYCAADLFIMPNIKVPGDMEGFGIVMLEANLMNTPVIASDLEGIKDVIEPGMNGYKVDPGDSEEFAATIDRVLNVELSELSEKCRSYVFDKFTWENVSKRYVHFLSEVIQKYKNS